MKQPKPLKQAHTSNAKTGMGDFQGSGIKQKVGRIREDYMTSAYKTKGKYGKAPKSLG